MYMATKHKHMILDDTRIKRAQKILGAKTERETVERALTMVIDEQKRNEKAWKAHEKFLNSGVEIEDVYGVLD